MIGMKKEEQHFIFKQSFYDKFYDGNNFDSKYIILVKTYLLVISEENLSTCSSVEFEFLNLEVTKSDYTSNFQKHV